MLLFMFIMKVLQFIFLKQHYFVQKARTEPLWLDVVSVYLRISMIDDLTHEISIKHSFCND